MSVSHPSVVLQQQDTQSEKEHPCEALIGRRVPTVESWRSER